MATALLDRRLPGADGLLGDGARAALAPAVASAGGTLEVLRPTQVRYEPGRRMLVRYRAEITWRGAGRRVETLGAVTSHGTLPDGLAVVESADGARAGVWRYPHDPYLPGLPHAGYLRGVRRVLARLGLGATEVRVEPVVYRPGTRAVLRVRTGTHQLYVKVLRPGEAAAIRRAHDAFGTRVRVPRCLAWSDELGLLVLEALPGRALTSALSDGGPAPDVASVLGVLDAIADVEVNNPPLAGAAVGYAGLLRRVLPSHATLVDALARAASSPAAPDRTVHGDFHAGQVLLRGAAVSGVLDIDGVRRGTDAEDVGSLVAHLLVTAHIRPAAAAAVVAFARQVLTRARRGAAWPSLHAAVTGHLLGLATTPFRRQEPAWPLRTARLIELADAWAHDSERALTPVSSPPHPPGARSRVTRSHTHGGQP